MSCGLSLTELILSVCQFKPGGSVRRIEFDRLSENRCGSGPVSQASVNLAELISDFVPVGHQAIDGLQGGCGFGPVFQSDIGGCQRVMIRRVGVAEVDGVADVIDGLTRFLGLERGDSPQVPGGMICGVSVENGLVKPDGMLQQARAMSLNGLVNM